MQKRIHYAIVPAEPVQLPFVCDFEKDFCGMTHRANDKSSWERREGPTMTDGTGPSGAKSGRWYIYVEASSPRVKGDKT